MKKILMISAFVLAIVVTGCHYTGPCLQGYGSVVTEERILQDFTEVVNAGSFEVRITNSDTFSVVVEAQENLMSIIETYVSGNELKIKTRNGTCINSDAPVIVFVTLPVLEGIKVTGSGKLVADRAECISFECINTGSGLISIDSIYAVDAIVENTGSGRIYLDGTYVDGLGFYQSGSSFIQAGVIYGASDINIDHNSSGRISAVLYDGNKLNANLTGSGRIELDGNAIDAGYHLTSSGKIDALGLMVADASATITGSGKIWVYATDFLDVKISGSGDVIYRGDPVLSIKITGSGSVEEYRE